MKLLTITLAFFAFMLTFAYTAVQAFDDGRLLLGWTLLAATVWCACVSTALVFRGEGE